MSPREDVAGRENMSPREDTMSPREDVAERRCRRLSDVAERCRRAMNVQVRNLGKGLGWRLGLGLGLGLEVSFRAGGEGLVGC